MDVQLMNLQQLCDVIMSVWIRIFDECFRHRVELCHEELRQLHYITYTC